MRFSFSEDQKQGLLWLFAALLVVALLVMLGPMLTPFIIAAVLAYILDPMVEALARRHLFGRLPTPRWLAVAIVLTVTIVAALALVLIIIPIVARELPMLQEQIPTFLSSLVDLVTQLLASAGIHVQIDMSGIRQLLTQKLFDNSESLVNTALASAMTGGSALVSFTANLLFIPMVLFYLLQDWDQVISRSARLVPRRWIGKVTSLFGEVDQLMAQYLRGQLLVMGILALYYSTALAIAGLDIALPVGILTGLLVFIPYIGFGMGLVLALISALLQFDGYTGLLIIGIIYGLGQLIESFYLTPRLVGERIGLHPLVVIFALLAFGQLFGFTGILLALPASAIMAVVIRHLYQHYLDSRFYNTQP